MLGAGIAVMKSHSSTHEEWEVEAIAIVSNKERIGPEQHSDGCNETEMRRGVGQRLCSG